MPPSESRRPALPADSEPRRCHAFTQFGTQASPGPGLGQQCTFALAWARAARSGAGPRRRGAGTSSVLDSEGPELSSGDQPGGRGAGDEPKGLRPDERLGRSDSDSDYRIRAPGNTPGWDPIGSGRTKVGTGPVGLCDGEGPDGTSGRPRWPGGAVMLYSTGSAHRAGPGRCVHRPPGPGPGVR
jgi:hypothetical protein